MLRGGDMKGKNGLILIFASMSMLLLIFDSKTALMGAKYGVDMCINAIIPSLLPFFFLSILLTGSILGVKSSFFRPLGRLLRIPSGSEPLVLIGLLGGYPVGAQCISQAYENGQLQSKDAERMLAFCNNCGPAFLFGILSGFFDEMWMLWALWGIHILSALLVGMTIPGQSVSVSAVSGRKISVTQALQRSISVMAQVCGWVILFRMLIAFLDRWVGFLLPDMAKPALWGLLELANGCFSLSAVADVGARFILCSAMLSHGGLCVAMQTFGVVSSGLSKRLYFPGKLLQCAYATMLSGLVCMLLFDGYYILPTVFACATLLLFLIFFRVFQKNSSILRPIHV